MMPGHLWMWFSSERQRLPQRDYSVTWYSHFLEPAADHLASRFGFQDIYLHGSIEVLAEEKPGSIRCWSPLLLYVSKRGNRVHVGFIWQISASTGYARSTMRSSVVWKNTAVAIIKSKKVYSVCCDFGESVRIFSYHPEWKEDNFLMFLTTLLLPARLCCWNSLLMQDFWSSPPVVALACLHILPIPASCRTGVFCCFEFSLKPNSVVFSPLNRSVWQA